MSETPPVVDLTPWFEGNEQQRVELCREVGQLCHRIGFFYVINHGIPAAVCDGYLRVSSNRRDAVSVIAARD